MSNDLRNKMLQWECKPPESTWDKVVTSLDADEEYALSRKLSSFQSQPPAHVWEHIEAGLNKREPGRLLSLYQQHKRVFQYTGAAAVLIFLAVITSLIVTNNSAPNELTQQSSVNQHHQQGVATTLSDEHENAHNTDAADSQNLSKTPIPLLPEANDHTTAKISSGKKTNNRNNTIISNWKQAKDSLVNRYFVHTNQNGESVRFSSKLYGLFECSEEWTESECSQQIKLWQQKAATSAMFASADFTGVIEVLKGMQESQ